jgi:hypothetical protein
MANNSPRRNRRVGRVKTRAGGYKLHFDLAKFHRSIGEVLGEVITDAGKPGGCEPTFTSGPREALSSYLLAEFLSKYDDGVVRPEKEEATWKRFREAEDLCFETNQRLTVSGFGPYQQAMELARKLTDRILGPFDWDQAAKYFDFGPGATTRLPRRRSDAAYKYSGQPETTAGCAILADTAIRRDPCWISSITMLPVEPLGFCKIVQGNRITTVPKNYKTDRTIAIEPCMNMYIQKGIGGLMRQRLRLAGCDLDDQTRNQRLARVGSLSGTLATIDLSMASDTVSRVLVERLVREDWLRALEQARSPFGVLPSGEKIFYQKHSSMGNGYTFELESLLFYSLALAWCHICGEEVSRVSAYGDDLIVPSVVAESFLGLLTYCGFKANSKKSYWSGPFRESCGKHYFRGHEISPFYVKRKVRKLTDLFLLHNNLQRWLWRSWDLLSVTEIQSLELILQKIRNLAPSKWRRPRLPDGYGDGAFIGVFDQLHLDPHPDGWEAWTVRVLLPSTEVQYVDSPGLLPKAMRCLYRRPRRPLVGMIYSPDEAAVEVYPVKETAARELNIIVPQYALGY